jgi:hypothetical protein
VVVTLDDERGYGAGEALTIWATLGEDFCPPKVVKAEAEEARRAMAAKNLFMVKSESACEVLRIC